MKFAVVVGINVFSVIDHSNDLRGCVPDAQHVRARLLARGWPAGNIAYLTDAAARKPAVVDALTAMLAAAHPGDHCVFFQSSHGTQVPDQDGDEADHLDEAICYHGICEDWAGSIMTDDEFGAILAGAKFGVIVTVILDLCHAGSATRNMVPGYRRSRFVTAPAAMPALPRHRFGRGWWGHSQRRRTGSVVIVPEMDHRLLAACRDNQTSADTDIDGPCGAFTHFLLAAEDRLRGECAGVVVTAVSRDLEATGYEQRPVVEEPPRLSPLAVFA